MNLFKFYDSFHLFSWAVMLLLLLIMNILTVTTFTVDLLVAHCCMSCSAGVSFHPTFSPAKWPSQPVTGRWCLWECGQSAPHSTGWQPQSQPCSCCASLKKASVSSYKCADVFNFHQTCQSPRVVSFPICSCHACTPLWKVAEEVFSLFESLLAFWTRSPQQSAHMQSKLNIVLKCDCIRSGICFLVGLSFLNQQLIKGRKKSKICMKLRLVKTAEQSSRLCALRKEQESTKRESWMWFNLQRQLTLLLMPVLKMIFGKQEALWRTRSMRLSWDSSILVQFHDLPNQTWLLIANKE